MQRKKHLHQHDNTCAAFRKHLTKHASTERAANLEKKRKKLKTQQKRGHEKVTHRAGTGELNDVLGL